MLPIIAGVMWVWGGTEVRPWGGGPDDDGAGGGGGDDSGLADTAGDEYLLYVLGFRGSGIRLKTQVDECYPL